MRWLSLFSFLLLTLAVGALGGRATASQIPTWYQSLHRPAIAPPNWLFAPVWTLLYCLMAVAVWRIFQLPPSPTRTLAIVLFFLQLALNALWSPLFFSMHQIGLAFFELCLMWLAIVTTTALYLRLDTVATALMLPYIAWVSFAGLLNFLYWRLN